MSGRPSWRIPGSLVPILVRRWRAVWRSTAVRSGRGVRLLAAIGVWCPGGVANRRVPWSDVARGPCWCPSRVRCNTSSERFVLGLVQVSDLECIAQFWNTRCRRIEQVVCFRSDANGLWL